MRATGTGADRARTSCAPGGSTGWLRATLPWVLRPTERRSRALLHDCFLPPDHLARAVRDRLGTDLVVLPGLGHLSVDDDPVGVARAVLTAVPGS